MSIYVLNKAYGSVSLKPRGFMRLRRTAVVAFIAGAVLLLFGGIGAFYLWKVTEKEVGSVSYTGIAFWIKISATVVQLFNTFGRVYQILHQVQSIKAVPDEVNQGGNTEFTVETKMPLCNDENLFTLDYLFFSMCSKLFCVLGVICIHAVMGGIL